MSYNGHPSDDPYNCLNRGTDEDWDVIMGHVNADNLRDHDALKQKWACCRNEEGTYIIRDELGLIVAMSQIKQIAVGMALKIAVRDKVAVRIVETEDETA